MEVQQDKTGPAMQQLRTWVVELQYLIVALMLHNPACKSELYSRKRDDSRTGAAPADKFYVDMIVRDVALLDIG